MILSSVQIHNYKSIADMEIILKPGVNLLIGDNGVGKTSVLEAITVGLGGYLKGITGISARGITQHDVRFKMPIIGDASSTKTYYTPVEIISKASLYNEEYQWTRLRKNELGQSKTTTSGSEIVKKVRQLPTT